MRGLDGLLQPGEGVGTNQGERKRCQELRAVEEGNKQTDPDPENGFNG